MRILWHSNAPWCPTGYGQQTALWVPKIAGLGHEVLVSAFYGLSGAPITWNGITVLPGNTTGDPYGSGLLREHVKHEKIDLVITLGDIWVLDPQHLKDMPVAHWLPVDCSPMSSMDAVALENSKATPIAMSRFGEIQLRQAGFRPMYVPHALHPVYTGPLPDREQCRKQFRLDGKFVVGLNAANKDAFRKGMFEQFAAFAILNRKHPDTALMVHGMVAEQGALDLLALARSCGIAHAVQFVDQYAYLTGRIPPAHLLDWYTALDLYSSCSLGEGFGIPIVEAQACGTPVVVTDASSMPEVAGSGWTVPGERFWNASHRACWVKPSIEAIACVYEKAYQRGSVYQAKRAKAREFALGFEADRVLNEYWKPALEQLGARL